jgi:hypothetical protein
MALDEEQRGGRSRPGLHMVQRIDPHRIESMTEHWHEQLRLGMTIRAEGP